LKENGSDRTGSLSAATTYRNLSHRRRHPPAGPCWTPRARRGQVEHVLRGAPARGNQRTERSTRRAEADGPARRARHDDELSGQVTAAGDLIVGWDCKRGTWPSLFVWLFSHQPAVLFSQNKSAISNQPTLLFFRNKSAPAIVSHRQNEQTTNWIFPLHGWGNVWFCFRRGGRTCRR
jgi:hypothetical protein